MPRSSAWAGGARPLSRRSRARARGCALPARSAAIRASFANMRQSNGSSSSTRSNRYSPIANRRGRAGDAAFAALRADHRRRSSGKGGLLREAADLEKGRGGARDRGLPGGRGGARGRHRQAVLSVAARAGSTGQKRRTRQILHLEAHFSNEVAGTFTAWRYSPEESPAGGMTGTGIHVLDALIAMAGPVRRVQALLLSHKPPPDPLDSLSVLLEFASGISGTLAAVRSTPIYLRVHAFGRNASAEALGRTELVLRRSGAEPQHLNFPPRRLGPRQPRSLRRRGRRRARRIRSRRARCSTRSLRSKPSPKRSRSDGRVREV